MSTIEMTAAKVAKARWLFYKSEEGKGIAPIQANESMIESYCDEHLLSLENVESWKLAAAALFGSLAENRDGLKVEKSRAEIPAPAPEPVLEGQELLRKLQADLRSDNLATRFEADDELKRIQAGPRLEGDSDIRYFARLYAPSTLRRLSEPQITFLRKKYGANVVAAAINLNQASGRY
jgi:hypothetical protein